MKFFRKYIFPALYGLMVYFTIRLLHDVEVDELFWKRDWALNIIEMSCSIFVGYLGIYLYEWLFRFYDKRWPLQLNYQGVVRELVILVIANLILMNLVFTPMAAFTDDGLSWADFADLNMIPTLYAIIYYGITRSSTWLKAYVANKVQLEKLTNDHLETELKFLKAQYHPHFLFNALNTVYFQMDEDVENAKKSIEKLSELLRYQLYDQQQMVPVSQELQYLESFIELQKVRSSDKLKVSININKGLDGQLVYPLLFLPLVENAFKYVGGQYLIEIEAILFEEKITFKVKNTVPDRQVIIKKESGIGLENLKRRLDILYTGQHMFKAGLDGGIYTAEITLNINNER